MNNIFKQGNNNDSSDFKKVKFRKRVNRRSKNILASIIDTYYLAEVFLLRITHLQMILHRKNHFFIHRGMSLIHAL